MPVSFRLPAANSVHFKGTVSRFGWCLFFWLDLTYTDLPQNRCMDAEDDQSWLQKRKDEWLKKVQF